MVHLRVKVEGKRISDLKLAAKENMEKEARIRKLNDRKLAGQI